MKRRAGKLKFDLAKMLNILFFSLTMISCFLNSSNTRAAMRAQPEYHVAVANHKFEGIRQFDTSYKLRPPRRFRASYSEFVVGLISSSSESRAFVSIGPVWRRSNAGRSAFFEFRISPTLINGSSFSGRDLGGNFHFISSAAIGVKFGQHDSLSMSLRIQHMSNGGLSSTNPGIDMIGVNFVLNSFK